MTGRNLHNIALTCNGGVEALDRGFAGYRSHDGHMVVQFSGQIVILPRYPTTSSDKDSPAADTRFTVRNMRQKGGQVTAVNLGDKDHDAFAFAAVSMVRGWIDQFEASGSHGK